MKIFSGNLAKLLILAIALVLISFNTFAFSEEDVKVSETIFVKGESDITITVNNNSSVAKTLDLDFIGPDWLQYEFIKYPDEIGKYDKATFKLRLTPLEEKLIGKQYSGKLIVMLDNETVKKDLSISFLSSASAEPPQPIDNTDQGNGNPGVDTVPLVIFTVQDIELAINLVLLAIIAVLMISLIRNMKK
ncbi:MAG: hypothetical protein AABW72_02855 [archaeon]